MYSANFPDYFGISAIEHKANTGVRQILNAALFLRVYFRVMEIKGSGFPVASEPAASKQLAVTDKVTPLPRPHQVRGTRLLFPPSPGPAGEAAAATSLNYLYKIYRIILYVQHWSIDPRVWPLLKTLRRLVPCLTDIYLYSVLRLHLICRKMLPESANHGNKGAPALMVRW